MNTWDATRERFVAFALQAGVDEVCAELPLSRAQVYRYVRGSVQTVPHIATRVAIERFIQEKTHAGNS